LEEKKEEIQMKVVYRKPLKKSHWKRSTVSLLYNPLSVNNSKRSWTG
jgi:hypothetical protein